jgi:N4-gp56 family major capsid protein
LDVAATAPPAPSRVTVSVDEYGDSTLETLRLKRLAFAPPDPAIAYIVGKNMVDTMDKLVQNVYDSATHVIGKNGGTLKSDHNGFAEGSVAASDKLDSDIIRQSVALLRRRNVHGKDAMDQFLALIHPDVAVDVVSDTGWLQPHNYVDPQNIYNAEVGSYLGARFIMTPRATVVADGAGGTTPVYRTYFLGRQGIVEAMVEEPHIVVGPQVDRFRRFFPIGWYAHGGWAIFRQEAIQIARTSASGSAL